MSSCFGRQFVKRLLNKGSGWRRRSPSGAPGKHLGLRCERPVWLAVVIGAIWTILAVPTAAETWQGLLEEGGHLRVDPESRRAVREDDRRPLWDGVHRLEDGSTVIIRDGIAVPTGDMLETWQKRPRPVPHAPRGACEQLVARACGAQGECDRAAACFHARGLRNAERAEQRLAPFEAGPRPATAATETCRAGLADASAFPPCAQAGQSPSEKDPCARLVTRVCGPEARCAAATPCRLAEQLRQMEREALSAASDPGGFAEIRGQCAEALTNAYFEPCE